MDNFQIETAQNVSIQQNVANIGDRILAYIIDSLIILGYFFIVIFVLAALDLNIADQWATWMVIGLPPFLYYLLWEMLWDGRTPGKEMMKIKVVKLDGGRPSLFNYLVRWLLRLLDISLAFGSIAIVSILLGGKGQRLGDMAAGTTVISQRKKTKFQQTIFVDLPTDYVPMYPQVTVFSDADIRKIKTIYRESRRDGNHKVIIELAKKISTIMDVTTDQKPLHFVDRVLADYSYYTQHV